MLQPGFRRAAAASVMVALVIGFAAGLACAQGSAPPATGPRSAPEIVAPPVAAIPADAPVPPEKPVTIQASPMLTTDPAIQAIFNLAMVELRQHNHGKAIELFSKAIAAEPGFAPAHGSRGVAQIGAGHFDLAAVDLTKALDLLGSSATPNLRASLLANRGLAYINLKAADKASADFDAAIAANPKEAFAYVNRGFVRYQQKNYDAAIHDATIAMSIEPRNTFAYMVRGYALVAKKQFEPAATDFLRVLSIAPDDQTAINWLRQAQLAGKTAEESKIKLVRLAAHECEPLCPEWIMIQGKIEAESADVFKTVLKEVGKRRVPVFVDSRGGAVDAALTMGRMIRTRALDVVVTGTDIVSCGKDDAACRKRTGNGQVLGRPRAIGALCASSCAFLLAAGTHRYAGRSGLVGVHQIISFRTTQQTWQRYISHREVRGGRVVEVSREVISETRGPKKTFQTKTNDETYVKVRKYFTEMGIDDSIMGLLLSKPSSDIHWLTAAELGSTHIVTEALQGEQLIARGGVALAGPNGAVGAALTVVPPAFALPTQPVAPRALSAEDMTRAIQVELARLGCTPGAVDGKWGQGVRRALERYNTLTGRPLQTSIPLSATLDALVARSGPVCPPACPPDLIESGGKCIAKTPGSEADKPKEKADSGSNRTLAPDGAPRVKTVALPRDDGPDTGRRRSERNPDGTSTTAPGADHACSNQQTICSGARRYCLSNCRERGQTYLCGQDCNKAYSNCLPSGVWRTSNCRKTGMLR